MDATGWDAFAADHIWDICLSQSMHKIKLQVCFLNCILHIILPQSQQNSTNNLAYTNIHPPYIQYHTNISQNVVDWVQGFCWGAVHGVFTKSEHHGCCDSGTYMDLGAGWVSRRGKGEGIRHPSPGGFFPPKIRCFVGNKNWGLVKLSFGPNFHVWDPYIALWFIIPILLGRKFVFSPMKKPSKPTHWRCWSIWRALDFPSQRPSNPWLGH